MASGDHVKSKDRPLLTVFARDAQGHRDLDVQYKAHRFAVWGERSGGEQGAVSLDARWRR